MALQCFERAVDWAGTSPTDSDTTKHAAEGADWDLYWGNYIRLKQAPDTSGWGLQMNQPAEICVDTSPRIPDEGPASVVIEMNHVGGC